MASDIDLSNLSGNTSNERTPIKSHSDTNKTKSRGNDTNPLATTTEFESTNISSSLLTDLTSNVSSSDSTLKTNKNKKQSLKDALYKKQLLHDIQKLKIELSQKDLLIDTMKAEHLNQLDDMEDKMNDIIHDKQLFQAKHEAQLQMIKNDSDNYIKRLKSELQESLAQQRKWKQYYEEGAVQSKDFRNEFIDVNINEEDYLKLKEKDENDLKSSEYALVKFYEVLRPLKLENEALHQRIELLIGDLKDKDEELRMEKENVEKERMGHSEVDVRCQRLQMQLSELQSKLSHHSYKDQNYDVVQGERDSFERKLGDINRQNTVYKSELEAKSDQLDMLRNTISEQNQSLALLKQDKDYLQNQLNEVSPRLKLMEEKYETCCKQLDNVKSAREELYEKYIHSRDHYKKEYEEKLKSEMSDLSKKMHNELEKIKESSKEMYERENRNLREAKTSAILEQGRLAKSEKEIQIKFNELLGEYRQLQTSSDGKLSEAKSEGKFKSFELDRLQLLHQEALNNVKQLGIQNDVLSQKNQTLNAEYLTLKGSSEKRIAELETKNENISSKLKIYEKLEQELDDVVMQAAELTNEADSERVLFAYGYGANVPSTAKRRMQQSVQLARRVLQLERANTSLRNEIESETKKTKLLSSELEQTSNLLNDARQPYNYLINSMKSRDEHNQSLKDTITTLERDIEKLSVENKSLKASNNQMSADLERLLNRREELGMLKQVISNMHSSTGIGTREAEKNKHLLTFSSSDAEEPPFSKVNASAKPIVFTKSDPPSWYTKLKKKNAMSKNK